MANGIDWFRWHHGSVNDPKFGLVAKKAGARVGDVIAVWALVLELASASNDRGEYSDIDCEATDFLLGADDGTTARILEAMHGRGLIEGGRIARWDARQPKREREAPEPSTSRVQKHRANKAALHGVTDDETPCNATERQETPREEKSREEKKEQKQSSKADATASRLPADWTPSSDDIAFCKTERPELIPQDVANQFRDYWVAQPGAKGRKADWPATWRNWVRNQRPQSRAGPPPQAPKFDPTAYVNRNRVQP